MWITGRMRELTLLCLVGKSLKCHVFSVMGQNIQRNHMDGWVCRIYTDTYSLVLGYCPSKTPPGTSTFIHKRMDAQSSNECEIWFQSQYFAFVFQLSECLNWNSLKEISGSRPVYSRSGSDSKALYPNITSFSANSSVVLKNSWYGC